MREPLTAATVDAPQPKEHMTRSRPTTFLASLVPIALQATTTFLLGVLLAHGSTLQSHPEAQRDASG
jgi:hypothetical protein